MHNAEDRSFLDLQKWAVLRAAARTGSLSAAARELNHTTSSVSQTITRLEQHLGQPLLVRHSRGVRLTQGGRIIVEHTDRIATELAAANARLRALNDLGAGRLVVAAVPTVTATVLPPAVRSVYHAHPGVTLDIRSLTLPDLYTALGRYDIDIGVIWHYSWEEFSPDVAIGTQALFDDPMYVALPRTHPLASRDNLPFEALRGERFITRRNDRRGDTVLIRAAGAAGFSPDVVFESNDYQEAQGLVAAEVGIALLPGLALSTIRDDIAAIRTPSKDLPLRNFLAAWPEQLAPSALGQKLIDLLTEVGQGRSPASRSPC